MAAPIAPDEVAALIALRDALLRAGHGQATPLKREFLRERHYTLATLHRHLRTYAGYAPERKPRADKGRTRLDDGAIHFMASARSQSLRQNARGTATMPIEVAMDVAAQNGFDINVSPGRVATLMRERLVDIGSQVAARNHIRMRSLHPNHVHQIDPSLCLVYYMGGEQRVMHESEFNKNKPAAMDKVLLKVWRYTRYDHASRSIDVRYFEAAGENQASLFEFLLWTWGQQDGRLSHGVPKLLLWDKGSANTSVGIRRLLDALGVRHEVHATHHAWAKGGVESANYIVERQFESRLRAEPVQTVAQLNAAALAWVRDYNANAIQHVDSRVRGDDGVARVRDDLWSLILQTPEALVRMPDKKVCAWFMTGREDTRQVRDSRITFVHPQSGKSELYDLQPYAGQIYNGQKLVVQPLLLADCALRLLLPAADGQERYIEVTPVREFDAFGRPLDNVVIGDAYRRAPTTAAEAAQAQLAAVAWGEGTTREQAEEHKRKNARPFARLNDGRGAVAHSHLGQQDMPARLLPEAKPVQTAAISDLRAAQQVARPIPIFAAAQQLAAQGVAMGAERFALLGQWYPEGQVPEDQIEALRQRLTVRAGLRVVGSDATPD